MGGAVRCRLVWAATIVVGGVVLAAQGLPTQVERVRYPVDYHSLCGASDPLYENGSTTPVPSVAWGPPLPPPVPRGGDRGGASVISDREPIRELVAAMFKRRFGAQARVRRMRRSRSSADAWCDEEDRQRGLKRLIMFPFVRSRFVPPMWCSYFDLTMRRKPLGDDGVMKVVLALIGRRYQNRDWRKLRMVVLRDQLITSVGAHRIAKFISACSAEPTRCAVDGRKNFHIDLRGNNIGKRGLEQLRAAVMRARLRGVIRPIVYYGGEIDESHRKANLLKLGAVELWLGKRVEVLSTEEFRIPPTLFDSFRPVLKVVAPSFWVALLAFVLGFLSSRIRLPVHISWKHHPKVRSSSSPSSSSHEETSGVKKERAPSFDRSID